MRNRQENERREGEETEEGRSIREKEWEEEMKTVNEDDEEKGCKTGEEGTRKGREGGRDLVS